MNTRRRSVNLLVALALLIPMLLVLAGCGALEVGAMPADMTADAETSTVQPDEIEIGIVPTPTPEVQTYSNNTYGFKFDYPETWSLSEEDHRVVLKKGTNQLSIFYRWVNEDARSGRTGMAAGTPIYSDKIVFLGQTVPVNVVELDHLAKYVLFGESGNVKVDDQAFTLVLEDLESDYMTLELPQAVIADARAILESFERIPATGSNPEAAPTQEPTPVSAAPGEVAMDMSVYENKEYGFMLSYPSSMSVVDEPNKVLVMDEGNCQMRIAYRRADEDVQIAEVGEVTGQLVPYHEIKFLGNPAGAVLEIKDDLIKAAFLGEPGVELGEGTPLRFVIRMVNTEGGRLANGQVDAMLQIFENFELVK